MGKKMLESEEVKEQIAKALVGGQSQAVIAQAVAVLESYHQDVRECSNAKFPFPFSHVCKYCKRRNPDNLPSG